MPYEDPKLPPGYEERVCKLGKGAQACSFLGSSAGGMRCLKRSAFDQIIRARRAAGSMRARGDNCAGPPSFEVATEKFDS